jgi:membrane-bound serine protease (ClpP class)
MSAALVFSLFVIGMLLVALEAFVIPGFGLPGILGAGILVWAAISAWDTLGPLWGMLFALISLLITVSMVVWIPKTRVGQRLTLRDRMTGTPGYDDEAKRAGVSVGATGSALTDLKPSGFALFGDDRVEVRSDGEWIDSGSPVVVTRMRDGRVFVERNGASEVATSAADTQSAVE